MRKDRLTARNGSPYLSLELRDRSGAIPARVFREVDRVSARFDAGDAVRVRGRAERFRGDLTAELDDVRRLDAGEFEASEFLPAAYRSVEELEGFLEHLTREVHDPGLRAVVDAILFREPVASEFRRAPCTGAGHHAYLGGLIEHTVSVATLAGELCPLHPRLDSDLLIAAALLHDVGKVREFTYGAEFGLTAEGDLVVLSGTEPSLRWRGFSELVVGAAERLGVEMVITLGALIADVPHTRPVPITGLATDRDLVERLGLSRSKYEGPTGIVGVIHDACRKRGLTSASLWAAVPHYVAAVPNPKAALALLRRLEGMTGVAIEASELEEAAERFDEQIDRAVAANPEIEELVQRLEQEQAESVDLSDDVPSGEALASEFQRFLRQRGKQDNGG